VVEDGAPFVEHVVDAKFDSAADYPAEGAVVVVYDVVYQEGVVELEDGCRFW
jgi:hypothetical protein